MIAVAVLLALEVGLVVAAGEVDLLNQISKLDTPALLVLFVWLLYKRKLVWSYQLDECLEREEEWKSAAGARTLEQEKAAKIAEAAMRAGTRRRP